MNKKHDDDDWTISDRIGWAILIVIVIAMILALTKLLPSK
jgi:hypothetical protein